MGGNAWKLGSRERTRRRHRKGGKESRGEKRSVKRFQGKLKKRQFLPVCWLLSPVHMGGRKKGAPGVVVDDCTQAKRLHSFCAKRVSGEATVSQWSTDPESHQRRGTREASS